MRILFISNLFPPGISGGYEIECRQVADSLFARGHEVHILTTRDLCPVLFQEEVSYSVTRTLMILQSFDSLIVSAKRLRKHFVEKHNRTITRQLINQFQPDLVFFWSSLRIGLGPAKASQDMHVPVVWRIGDENLKGYVPSVFKFSLKDMYRGFRDQYLFSGFTLKNVDFSHAICISQMTKDNLMKGGVPVEKAIVIYKGIVIDYFPVKKHLGEISHPVRLLYVGRIHPEKGLESLLEALRLLKQNTTLSITLTIVGVGAEHYEEKLKQFVKEANLSVDFHGFVSYSHLGLIYRSHDLFVFPSICPEGQGSTYLEAMASGIPVISTDKGGQGELLEDGVNALIFPPQDASILASKINQLVEDATLRKKLAINGRKFVETHCTFEGYVDHLEEFLDDVHNETKTKEKL